MHQTRRLLDQVHALPVLGDAHVLNHVKQVQRGELRHLKQSVHAVQDDLCWGHLGVPTSRRQQAGELVPQLLHGCRHAQVGRGGLDRAFPEAVRELAQGLEDGHVGVAGEGEAGDCFEHLQGGLLLREDVVDGLWEDEGEKLVEEILGGGGRKREGEGKGGEEEGEKEEEREGEGRRRRERGEGRGEEREREEGERERGRGGREGEGRRRERGRKITYKVATTRHDIL